MQALSDDALRHKTVEFRERLANAGRRARGRPQRPADRGVRRHPRGGPAGHRPAPLRRAAHGRRRPALRLDRRDEDRRGQDPRLHPARLPQRPHRQGRAPHHRQRLPGQARRRVDGPDPPVARASTVGLVVARRPTTAPAQAGGLRLPTSPTAPTTSSASTTSATTWPCRSEQMVQRGHAYAIVDEVDSILIDEARTPLIISGRVARRGRALLPVRRHRPQASPATSTTRSTRRSARSRPPRRASRRSSRRSASRTSTTSCRSTTSTSCQAALRAKELYKRDKDYVVQRRRGEDRRRVHRPHPRGPALVRGPAPGGRGQGAGADQGGEPDPRHHHPPELLPHVREARRHDRHGRDRGRRVRPHLQPAGRAHPHPPADGPRRTRPTSSTRPRTAKFDAVVDDLVERYETGQPVLVGTVSVEKSERLSRLLEKRGIPHAVLNAKQHDAGGR